MRDVTLVSLSLESAHGEQVCLLMEISAKEEGAKTVEQECTAIVRHALLESDGPAAERLDSTLKEMNGLLKGMLVSNVVSDVHMLIGIVDSEDTLHVSHAGRAEAYLIRRGVASQITEYSSGKPAPAFIHIASGKLERRDLLVLSSQRLLRTLTPAQLSKLTQKSGHGLIDALVSALEADGEHAALATMHMPGADVMEDSQEEQSRSTVQDRIARRRRTQQSSVVSRVVSWLPSASAVTQWLPSRERVAGIASRGASKASSLPMVDAMREKFGTFLEDLNHPKRRKRAHLLLLASSLALLIVIWALVHVFTSSQRSKTRADLEALMQQINVEIQTADNKRIIGDVDSANKILQRAEDRAKQVMDNESGLFRTEANDLLGRIRGKKEEINSIIRLSPRTVANLTVKNPTIAAQGMVGLGDGEFLVYDPSDLYRVLLNSVEEPHRISEDVHILDASHFPRFQADLFLMTGNTVIEWAAGQAISMKTDDPKGWVNGRAVSAYLRFLYMLSPENNQIYKYERLNNRYSAPVGYNVNGNLKGAIDMAIDGSVYVLKEGGAIVKLFRGETQSFNVRKAPENVLKDTTKIIKVADRNFYLLDPTHARIIVLSDGGVSGESSYLKQYVLEGTGELKDLYVDPDEAHLYLLDEKHVYVVDLNTK